MIAILLLTYDRMRYARATLDAVAEHLRAPEELWLHIADDGSPQEYRDELLEIARGYYGGNVSVSNSERRGYGGNYNLATHTVHEIADLVLPLEDDWRLTRDFDLTPCINVLRSGIFNCVRLNYLGYTQELRGRFVWAEELQWIELDPASPERHVFSGGPRLETVAFERSVGLWPEGWEQGATEFEVAGREEARQKIAWPVDLVHPRGDCFAHVGTIKAGTEPVPA